MKKRSGLTWGTAIASVALASFGMGGVSVAASLMPQSVAAGSPITICGDLALSGGYTQIGATDNYGAVAFFKHVDAPAESTVTKLPT